MSFSSDVKAELCRSPVTRACCAVAEAYGVLLYANTFTHRECSSYSPTSSSKKASGRASVTSAGVMP